MRSLHLRDSIKERLDEWRDDLAFAREGVSLHFAETGDWVADRIGLPPLPRWLPIAGAAIAVGGGLYLIQGDGEAPAPAATTAARPAVTNSAQPANAMLASGAATLVKGAGFSLALPAGWVETTPPADATFAAVSADGLADATLWITEAPKLSFARFEGESLIQLAKLSADARLVHRIRGPSLETSVVELAAGAEGASADAPYRVTLRAAGPYRYYLATSLDGNAPATLVGETELLRGTLRPDVAGAVGD